MKMYHNPRCSKSRQALQLIRGQGLKPEIILYLVLPPAVGVVVIVNVTVSPALMLVESDTNDTDFKYVPA